MSPSRIKPAALSNAQRAGLFRAVARLEQAGIPAHRAAAALGDLLGARHAHRFGRMTAEISAGATWAEAGGRAGLFSARDREIVRLAERSGTLARAAAMLADGYEYRARIFAKLRGRMMLPLLILVLGLFLLPLPALVSGRLGPGEYFWQTLGPIAALAVALSLGSSIAQQISARGLSAATGRLSLTVPVLARATRLQLMEGLALLLQAGVPAREAMNATLTSLGNPAARRRYAPVLERVESEGVSSALRGVDALEPDEFAIVSASEEAGRLADGIERIAAKLRQEIEHLLELLSEWLPRAVYLVVIALIAAGLIG